MISVPTSNERVPLKANMRMIFEIRDLVYATPATVSRAGILYISTDKGTQWKSLIESWIQRRDSMGMISDVQVRRSRQVERPFNGTAVTAGSNCWDCWE